MSACNEGFVDQRDFIIREIIEAEQATVTLQSGAT
jgi:hypothetical protein